MISYREKEGGVWQNDRNILPHFPITIAYVIKCFASQMHAGPKCKFL